MLNPAGPMLTILRRPARTLPISCKGDCRIPPAGRAELQLVSGVLTIRLQFVRRDERRNWIGSSKIENAPEALVVALETTFPAPHCN